MAYPYWRNVTGFASTQLYKSAQVIYKPVQRLYTGTDTFLYKPAPRLYVPVRSGAPYARITSIIPYQSSVNPHQGSKTSVFASIYKPAP